MSRLALLLVITMLGPAASVAQEVIWANRYEDSAGGDKPSIARGRDGSFVVLGRTRRDVPPPGNMSYVMRIRSDGRKVWDSVGILARGIRPQWVLPARDRGWFLLGPYLDGGLSVSYLDANGGVFARRFGDSRTVFTVGEARSTRDSGLVVAGIYHEPTDTSASIDVMKFDWNGTAKWHKQYSVPRLNIVRAIRELSDGSIVLVSWTLESSAVVVTKVDAQGWHLWTRAIASDDTIGADDIAERPDGGLIVAASLGQSRRVALYQLSSADGSVEADTVHLDLGAVQQMERSDAGGYLLRTWNKGAFVHKIGDDGSLLWSHAVSYFGDATVSDMLPFRGYLALVATTPFQGIHVAVLREPSTSGAELIDLLPAEMDLR